MSRRKHISWKTKYASALLALGDVPYEHAKLISEDQLISLYQLDHGILHETGHPDRDAYWNQTPRLIMAHRSKTRQDAAIIAKGRRIRAKFYYAVAEAPASRTEPDEFQRHAGHGAHGAAAPRPARLRSRGFDKRLKRKMDGTVVRR